MEISVRRRFRAAADALRARTHRVRTPTVLQMEAVECGAASLAMVLAYHGRVLPLEEVREACNVTRDGTKASNVVRAARRYGLQADGYRRTPEALRSMPMPVVLHWNLTHFVVLEGFGKDRAYLNDPAYGRYRVSMEDFSRSFTGIVLTFAPGPGFEKSRSKPGLFESLSARLAHSKKAVAFVLLTTLTLVVPGLVIPAFTRVFVDYVLVQRLYDWIGPLLGLMAVVLVVQTLLAALQQRYLAQLEAKLALSTSGALLWHLLHLPIRFFQQRYAGDIASRAEANERVAQLLSGQLATTFLSLTTLGFYVGLMFLYDGVLTLVSLGLLLVNGAALRWVMYRRRDATFRVERERGRLVGVTSNGIQLIETLKASGGQSDFFTTWSGYFAKMVNAEQESDRHGQYLLAIPAFLTALNTTLVLVVGGLRVMDGLMTLGTLVAYKYLLDSITAPVVQLVQLGSTLQSAEADLSRVDDVERYPRDVYARPGPAILDRTRPVKLTGAVELRDVAFGYSPIDAPLIEGFDLRVEPGQRVAIVGASGSGKSTLARLVTGLYEPTRGVVLFDGRPREAHPRLVTSNSIALVDQDVLLFEDTVRANLTLWDRTLPDERLVEAARDAEIHDEIARRPGGYHGRVAEGGRNFSGGQRQRLELARALAQNPSILVLDEATSALDPVTEVRVMERLRRRGCTCIVVAHRLSTIRDADEIIVLDRGRVVERGSHAALLAAENAYAALVAEA